jgi:hypothetical protein
LDLHKLVRPVPEAGPMLKKLTVTFWLQGWTVVGKFDYDDSPLIAVDHFALEPNARKTIHEQGRASFCCFKMSRRHR